MSISFAGLSVLIFVLSGSQQLLPKTNKPEGCWMLYYIRLHQDIRKVVLTLFREVWERVFGVWWQVEGNNLAQTHV